MYRKQHECQQWALSCASVKFSEKNWASAQTQQTLRKRWKSENFLPFFLFYWASCFSLPSAKKSKHHRRRRLLDKKCARRGQKRARRVCGMKKRGNKKLCWKLWKMLSVLSHGWWYWSGYKCSRARKGGNGRLRWNGWWWYAAVSLLMSSLSQRMKHTDFERDMMANFIVMTSTRSGWCGE